MVAGSAIELTPRPRNNTKSIRQKVPPKGKSNWSARVLMVKAVMLSPGKIEWGKTLAQILRASVLATALDTVVGTIQKMLHEALADLLKHDLDLIAIGGHEQAICHRLAVYLERRTDLHVDCEYNRDMEATKYVAENLRKVDVIIHERLSSSYNLLAVEAKTK